MLKNVLVTGGAGYIGSHTVKELIKYHYFPLVYDNLSSGHKAAILGGKFIRGDLRDRQKLARIFQKYQPQAVIHLAARIDVAESMQNPDLYFRENVLNSLNLLNCMQKYGVDKLVFSSTAAVYGEPLKIPIKEEATLKPNNIYGLTKALVEKILEIYECRFGIKYVSLRYFNAAGADPEGKLGEDHFPETHLIPRLIKTALGQFEVFTIFGNDYQTPDGTCIRDYIHVTDLAQAHILALKYLEKNSPSRIFNLGNEKGNSVLEIVNWVKRISGIDFPVKIGPRRVGDPARLVASAQKIKKELGWKPKYSDIATIIKTAWIWHKNHPYGFKKY